MKSLDYTKGAPPLYMQIYQDLKEKIIGKEYEYGKNIPTELELQEYYGVSRITVRQAIFSLEREGLVVRTRGKGTIVCKQEVIEELLSSIKSFTEEMRERNMIPGTKFAEVSKVQANETLADIFSCETGAPLYRIRRIRTANEKPIVLFDTYISGRYQLPLENEPYYGSLYRLLEDLGIQAPVGIEERFEAVTADSEIAGALGVHIGDPIMKRTRISFDSDVNVLEYTLSYYNAAHYTYVVYAGTTDKNTQDKNTEEQKD
ncbi:MAG TPA: GntR family transcriptional regulator [Firmicutes bacterium]|nr:GntR family transcriptional regulator [Bacillota bacterium]